jgi:hypothetical protein
MSSSFARIAARRSQKRLTTMKSIKQWARDRGTTPQNVEHIHPLPAGAEVDHGVEVQATENHGKETAGRGLDGAAC